MDDPGVVDKYRPVQSKYYELMERADQENLPYPNAIKLLKWLIEEDLDFLAPYLELYEIYQIENKPKKPVKFWMKRINEPLI